MRDDLPRRRRRGEKEEEEGRRGTPMRISKTRKRKDVKIRRGMDKNIIQCLCGLVSRLAIC
jgi:hypothetical protein